MFELIDTTDLFENSNIVVIELKFADHGVVAYRTDIAIKDNNGDIVDIITVIG